MLGCTEELLDVVTGELEVEEELLVDVCRVVEVVDTDEEVLELVVALLRDTLVLLLVLRDDEVVVALDP